MPELLQAGSPAPAPARALELPAAYRLIAELLLYPEDRDRAAIEAGLRRLAAAPPELKAPIGKFVATPRGEDLDEYLAVLELTPPCPLYLGAYIFEEPTSCRGAGISGRNGYMIELAAIYRHYGYELDKRELADFIPALAEFLAISLEQKERDGIGLRPRLLKTYVQPGLAPMRKALAKFESPYGLLIEALEAAVENDIAASADEPMWTPPARTDRPIRGRVAAAPAL